MPHVRHVCVLLPLIMSHVRHAHLGLHTGVRLCGKTIFIWFFGCGFACASCKGCDPCGQLLCGMLQVPSAVHTLYTHSMAAHGRRTGAHNTCSHTVAGPAFVLQFGTIIGFIVV